MRIATEDTHSNLAAVYLNKNSLEKEDSVLFNRRFLQLRYIFKLPFYVTPILLYAVFSRHISIYSPPADHGTFFDIDIISDPKSDANNESVQ